jgi:TRAP-type transport system small permease protein
MFLALERLALTATRGLSILGLVALMGLATMTLVDGLMRWIANQPIEGVRDLSGLAIAMAIACCLPIVMVERGNITIRLAALISDRLSRFLDAVAALLVLVVLAVLAWQIFLYAMKMMSARETTFVLQIPVAPFWFATDVVLWCAVLVQAIVVLRTTAGAISR